jgi:tRNA(Ile2) C34 agmatinyltransferase TiaS
MSKQEIWRNEAIHHLEDTTQYCGDFQRSQCLKKKTCLKFTVEATAALNLIVYKSCRKYTIWLDESIESKINGKPENINVITKRYKHIRIINEPPKTLCKYCGKPIDMPANKNWYCEKCLTLKESQ